MGIEQYQPPKSWWAKCDHCGKDFEGGAEYEYVSHLIKELERAEWDIDTEDASCICPECVELR